MNSKTPSRDAVTLTLRVEGMTCAGCVRAVEAALSRLPGVHSATVNLLTRDAVVTFDSGMRTPQDLLEAVRQAGYEAHTKVADERPSEDATLLELAAAGRRAVMGWLLAGPVAVIMFAHMIGAVHIHSFVWMETVVALPVLLISGAATYVKGVRTALHLRPNMDTLISIGTGAAFITGPLNLLELPVASYAGVAAMIMAFHLTGRYLEARARGRASQAIRRLLDLGPKTALVERNGANVEVAIDEVRAGDVFLVRPGERIATDGTVLSGHSAIDESMATGESLPIDKSPSDMVLGGTVNTTGAMRVRATRVGRDTFLAQVARVVQEAQTSKVPVQEFADRITGVFVPVVLLTALATFAMWMLFPLPMNAVAGRLAGRLPWTPDVGASDLSRAVFAAVAVLVIACPCAMGLATPTALMVATGVGASRGILIRNGATLQLLGQVRTICLDKTGTLTQGKPVVTRVVPCNNYETREVLIGAGSVEALSEHPIAQAIVAKAKEEGLTLLPAKGFETVPGMGARATVNSPSCLSRLSCPPCPSSAFPNATIAGTTLCVGKEAYLASLGIDLTPVQPALQQTCANGETAVLVAADGCAIGLIAVADTLKEDAAVAVHTLKTMGMEVVMLTGDNARTAAAVAQKLGIHRVLAEVLPKEKRRAVAQLQQQAGPVAMVGDGINDAAALAQADVGVAVGAGTDIAIEAADVTLIRPDLRILPEAVELSRAAFRKIKQNLAWAFGYNLLAVPLAILGLLHPLVAELAMAASSIHVVTNSLRLRRHPGRSPQ